MENFGAKILAVVVAIVLVLLFIDIVEPVYGFFAKVDAGHVGIVDHFGSVKDEALQPGFHLTHFFEKVVQVDARTQKGTVELEAFSSDIQQVVIKEGINYNISASMAGTLYKTVGTHYADTLIYPRLLENTKAVIGNYTAEALIANREAISAQILSKMQNDLAQYGIVVTVISIENIDFTDAFENAVEAKQVATQEKQRAKTQQEQATMEAQQEAEREKIAANAAAEIAKINADAEAYAIKAKAEAEAEANRKIAESITEKLIDYTEAQNWDGKLPNTYVGSGDALPVIQTENSEVG